MAKGLNGNYDQFAIAGADSWYSVGSQRRARGQQRPC